VLEMHTLRRWSLRTTSRYVLRLGHAISDLHCKQSTVETPVKVLGNSDS
jgi:hypothetical protein